MAFYGITIKDLAGPKQRQFVDGVASGAWKKPAGASVISLIKAHLADKNASPASHQTASRLGAQPSDIYMEMADATHYTPTSDGVTVSINHPAAAQRYYGGEIRPVNVSRLTIPAIAAAYGHRARESGIDLKFMFAPDENGRWRPALVAPDAVTKSVGPARKDGTRRQKVIKPSGIWYWLVRSVRQKADETLLPNMADIGFAVEKGLREWVDGMKARTSNA